MPPYAAPARQTDYTGLPPAYTFVGDIEPFDAETKQYIAALQAAGVEAVMDEYHSGFPGCFHAFDMMMPWRRVSREAAFRFEKHFAEAQLHAFAYQTDDGANKRAD